MKRQITKQPKHLAKHLGQAECRPSSFQAKISSHEEIAKLKKIIPEAAKWSRHLWLWSEGVAWQIDIQTKLAKNSKNSKDINQSKAIPDHAFIGDGACGDPPPPPTPAHSTSLRMKKIRRLDFCVGLSKKSGGMLRTTRILASCFCQSKLFNSCSTVTVY